MLVGVKGRILQEHAGQRATGRYALLLGVSGPMMENGTDLE
jgi:hypothetical protein